MFATVIAVLMVEVFCRLPILRDVADMVALGTKITKVIRSRHISDHWKERVLVRYAGRLAWYSCKIFLWLLGVAAAIIGFAWTVDRFSGAADSTIGFLSSATGLAFATGVSIAYYVLRRRVV